MKRLALLLVLMGCLVLPGLAQTVSFRGGVVLEPSQDTPKPKGLVGFVVGNGDTRNITTFTLASVESQTVTGVRTGVERTLFKLSAVEIAACGEVGFVLGQDTTSGDFSGCTVVIVPIKWGFAAVITGGARNAPATGGTWDPQTSISLQWTPK